MEHITIHTVEKDIKKENLFDFPFLYPEENFNTAKQHPFLIDITEPRVYEFPSKKDVVLGNIIVIPGGGYSGLSVWKEGYEVAQYFISHGYRVFLAVYRMPKKPLNQNIPFIDVQHIVQSIIKKYNNQKLGFISFSAGAHCLLHVLTNKKYISKTMIAFKNYLSFCAVIYPLTILDKNNTHSGSHAKLIVNRTDEKKYNINFDEDLLKIPLFIAHGIRDEKVPFNHATSLKLQALAQKIPCKFLPLDTTTHGFGLFCDNNINYTWANELIAFLNNLKNETT